jgi:hypothetical protein
MSGAQDIVAIAVALFAAAYLVYRLGGFRRRRRGPKPAPIHLGSRLERGIKTAKDQAREP